MGKLFADLEFRGLVYQVTDPTLAGLLDGDEQLTGYIGFDPTADSLHVGHLLQVCNLRRLQLAGHRPIAVAGGGTGMIGDPGGKNEERELLSVEQVRANLEGIRPQLERFLDFSPAAGASQAVMADNGDWTLTMGLVEFLRDVGKHFTVNQMLAKESVRGRLERPDQGISFTEFSYMLLQAYDFLRLFDAYGCRLQLGGSDQWGNITMGVDLVRKLRRAEVFGLTSPLVLNADGTKFGKTGSNTVWLDPKRTSPYALYQFFMRTEDAVVSSYLRLFTFLGRDDIEALDEATAAQPQKRQAQRALAREVCTLVHGETETARAERAAQALFSEEISTLDESSLLEVCAEAPTTDWPRTAMDAAGGEEGLTLVDVLVRTGLVSSKGQARTTIEQGGAYVNNRRVGDVEARLRHADLLFDKYVVLRRGRRDYHLLVFG